MTGVTRKRCGDTLRQHMTVANQEFQAKLDATPQGMFSWAGSGPVDCFCFGCAHFDRVDKPRKPELPHRCKRWAAWYRGTYASHTAPRLYVPPQTPACMAYTARPAPAEASQDTNEFHGPVAPLHLFQQEE